MNEIDRLSVQLNLAQLDNIINSNNTPYPINAYGLKQAKQAKELYQQDYVVIKRLATGKHGNDFIELFNNGQLFFDYIHKYKRVKYAIGSLAMRILKATNGDINQTNRILHRSKAFKFWTDEKSLSDDNIKLAKWDLIYRTTEVNNIKTNGEVFLERLLVKTTKTVA